ncbi:DUF11 domain-containing protein [Deinococcus sp. Arct2-2]|uniref:DUF11 domain-containing protein n=1 Tax=Deinococcus sp. Arct2-2 TaxID=2568653 RepID=UPI0010A2B4C2|nr:DUF11 domain-containing protein [Deinococcus sp. Arct2-2]THF68068.1 DUF11 domain-containing protein [Deinococcus sp. Arct2-2]
MRSHSPLLLLTGALLTSVASAQAASPLTLTLSQALVRAVTVDGKATEQLAADPKNVRPGDVLSQMVTARNIGNKALTNVTVRLPVPKGTTYLKAETVMNTALSNAKAEYSIDGGKTYATAPLKKIVMVTENGKSVKKEVEVKPSEYTNVRWMLPHIDAGTELKIGFRVQVN